VAGSQASAVQTLSSSMFGGVPGWQTPDPSQDSSPLHRFESAQDVPAVTGV